MAFLTNRLWGREPKPRVLIVIENMSYTYDTRMRKIARTLEATGYRVGVICPRYPGDPWRRVEGNVTVTFYPLPWLPPGVSGHMIEYLYSFTVITGLTLLSFITHRFHIIHICNPPDIFFLLGRFYRFFGCRFIFDMHDLCPELVQVRYAKYPFLRPLLLAAERATLRAANHVLVTSETARASACDRGDIEPERVTLVYNGPDMTYFPVPMATNQCTPIIEVGYIGDMNPQDGIDNLLLAAQHIRYDLHRTDVKFVCIGDGSAYESLRRQAHELRLEGVVSFTGRLPPREAMQRLRDCALCVQPDPKNTFTDSCVMVKSLEYMALGKAFVAFDLVETQRVCRDAALYAHRSCTHDLARCILLLVDDQDLRRHLGEYGRRRIEEGLAWSFSQQVLLDVYLEMQARKPPTRRALPKTAHKPIAN